MMTENSFGGFVQQKEEWEGYGQRLSVILAELQAKIGDSPIYVDESGDFGVHPQALQKLQEPGNEGPLEFLLYMQRTSKSHPEGLDD